MPWRLPSESGSNHPYRGSDLHVTGALLDVDGTLVDSNYLHAVCWAEAFAQHGVAVPTARLHRLIGMDAIRLVEEVGGPVEEVKAAHATLYRQHWGRLRPLPGARELLAALAPVVLVSSASGPELAALRRALDADDCVKDATSGDDVREGKPDDALVRRGLELLGTESAVLVGDSVWDGLACRSAGVPFVALTCGGTCEEALRDAGAVEVWQDPRDLVVHLDRSVLRRS